MQKWLNYMKERSSGWCRVGFEVRFKVLLRTGERQWLPVPVGCSRLLAVALY